jgi:hypothetical protein
MSYCMKRTIYMFGYLFYTDFKLFRLILVPYLRSNFARYHNTCYKLSQFIALMNMWPMTLYKLAYHWLPLRLSQEKRIVGFWNMQVQQMWRRKLLGALTATVAMWRVVMQLTLQQWVERQHTPHCVARKLGNTVNGQNGISVHFIPTQIWIHQ